VPAAANCHEPEREAENRAGNRHCGRREPQRGADHDYGRAGQGGNGVKIGAQHDGDLRQEHIAVMPPPIPVSMPRSAAMIGLSRRHRLSTSVPRFNNITMGDRRARDKIPVILPEWMRGVGAAAYQLLKSREVAEDLGSCPPAI
jgi:hypothetical protein